MSNYQALLRRDYQTVESVEIDPYKINIGLSAIRDGLENVTLTPANHEAIQEVYELLKSVSRLITQ